MIQRDDRAMIESPSEWPQYPFLPVKRYKGKKPGELADLGVIWIGAPNRVAHGDTVNLWALPKTQEGFRALPHTDYADAAAIVADGWIVD